MESTGTYKTSACGGCSRHAGILRVVDGTLLCDGCAARSAEIDRQLAGVRATDQVLCDGCLDRVNFDARMAIVVRECGGAVLCDDCKVRAMQREVT